MKNLPLKKKRLTVNKFNKNVHRLKVLVQKTPVNATTFGPDNSGCNKLQVVLNGVIKD